VVVLATILLLILGRSSPPEIIVAPEATQRAEEKIQDFQLSAMRGTARKLEMGESELNGWLDAQTNGNWQLPISFLDLFINST
jgi:hypothetical protein